VNTFAFQIIWKLSVISLLAVACVFGTANAGDMGGGTVVFAGADARERAYFSYGGLIHHFSGDILSNGFLVRVAGFNSRYNYKTPAVSGGTVEADAALIDGMVGYQMVTESYALRGFVGLDYEDHSLSPNNAFDPNQGSHFGSKVQGEFETDFASPYYVNLMSSYGSARDRYWARARAGYDFSGYVVGPEARFTGDRIYDDQRFGAFLTFRNILPVMATVSAGSSDSGDRAGVVPYIATELSITF